MENVCIIFGLGLFILNCLNIPASTLIPAGFCEKAGQVTGAEQDNIMGELRAVGGPRALGQFRSTDWVKVA